MTVPTFTYYFNNIVLEKLVNITTPKNTYRKEFIFHFLVKVDFFYPHLYWTRGEFGHVDYTLR